MRIYELGFILKPDMPEQEVEAAIGLVKDSLEGGGARIVNIDDWGKRKLAYRIKGFWSGHYVFVQYSVQDAGSLTREVERRLRVADNVIKFMTIRIDEDLKRLKKAKTKRAKRAPRLAARAAARGTETARPRPSTPGRPGRPPASPVKGAGAA